MLNPIRLFLVILQRKYFRKMYSTFDKIKIKAIATSTPDRIERNVDLPFDKDALNRVIDITGIEERRVADGDTCSTDLICHAAADLIAKEGIDPMDIGVMVLVTQFADYIVPSSAHIVQKRLGLSDNALAIQVNEGCSGYVYGLQLAYSLLTTNNTKYALVLVEYVMLVIRVLGHFLEMRVQPHCYIRIKLTIVLLHSN